MCVRVNGFVWKYKRNLASFRDLLKLFAGQIRNVRSRILPWFSLSCNCIPIFFSFLYFVLLTWRQINQLSKTLYVTSRWAEGARALRQDHLTDIQALLWTQHGFYWSGGSFVPYIKMPILWLFGYRLFVHEIRLNSVFNTSRNITHVNTKFVKKYTHILTHT